MRPPFFPPPSLIRGIPQQLLIKYLYVDLRVLLVCPSSIFIYFILFNFFFLSYLFGLIISPILKIHPFFLPYLFVLSHHWNSFTKYEQIFCRVCLFFFLADSSGKQTNRLTESAKIEFYFLFFEEIFLLLFGARLLLLLTGFRVSRISKLSEILIFPHWILFFLDVRLFFFFLRVCTLDDLIAWWEWCSAVISFRLFSFFFLRGIIFTFFI